jgi:hypothetical protein
MAITTSSDGQVSSSAKAVRISADRILVFVEKRLEVYAKDQSGRRTYETCTRRAVVLVPTCHGTVDDVIRGVLLGLVSYESVSEVNEPERYKELVRLAGCAEDAHERKELESSKCLDSYRTGENLDLVEVHVGQLHGLWYVKEVSVDVDVDVDDDATNEAFATEEEATCVARAHLLVKRGSK